MCNCVYIYIHTRVYIEFRNHSVTHPHTHFAERRSKLEKFSHQAKNWSMWPFLARSRAMAFVKSAHVHSWNDMSSTAFLIFFLMAQNLIICKLSPIWGLISHNVFCLFGRVGSSTSPGFSTSARPSGWSVLPGYSFLFLRPSGELTSTLPNKGWKMSFHSKSMILRVKLVIHQRHPERGTT